jgi:hypothetical protein
VSKISLAPDASGTGIFTIASPNSNTNRTLTLPDDTGTIVTDSGNQAGSFTTLNTSGAVVFNDAGADVDFRVESDTVENALFVDGSNGNIGLGTTAAVTKATVYGSGDQKLSLVSPTGSSTQVGINLSPSMTDAEAAANPAQAAIYATDSSYSANIIFANKATGAVGNALTERMRIDSSGQVIVGPFGGNGNAVVAGSSSPGYTNQPGTNLLLKSGDGSGTGFSFMSFSTSPAGSSGTTVNTAAERMRIDSSGDLLVGKTANTFSVAGTALYANGEVNIVRSASIPLYINRLTDDGQLIRFHQDTVEEGNISVSGSTVSYNGGHLSRYGHRCSQSLTCSKAQSCQTSMR